MYEVLQTIDNDGKLLTDEHPNERVYLKTENYTEALTEAKSRRTSLYRHNRTGEIRLYSELDTTGAAYREDDDGSVWRFVQASTIIGHRGYAIVVESKDLHLYDSKA